MDLKSIIVCSMTLFGCIDETIDETSDASHLEHAQADPAEDDSEDSIVEQEHPDEAEAFDSCPEDTYVLLEEPDGTRYVIVIPVFCEPMTDIYLGCPSPF
jgi:hypothetical protein